MPADAELPLAPDTVADGGGFPRFGTYRGGLREVDLRQLRGPYALPLPARLFKHKTWQYAQVCTREVLALFSIADLGYTANAFVTVVDLRERRALFDQGFMGLPGLTRVSDRPGEGLRAIFRLPGVRFSCGRAEGGERYDVDLSVGGGPLRSRGLSWQGYISPESAGPPLSVIAPVPQGVVNVTQKWCGLSAGGSLRVDSRRVELSGGVAGLDYTQGYLARRTIWRWAMANGQLADGTPVGLNLVQGFNESDDAANENAVWLGRRLFALGRAKLELNTDDPLDTWRVSTLDGAVDLTFQPIYAHREDRDYRVVKSRFVQPIGLFRGTIRVGGQVHPVDDLAGVTEDQDTLW